ncbi:hypothetical protein [Natrinema sp. 1APR25-10V2]|uniref:DUF7260 family protein n=1 Tax=Natrinema sp. 1APR25-10V2 TaxID=2951081 RepID=UPI00287498F0|nr:hypothetical protein [Natrinema sp. 1APR25-10V2]MDS0476095.1 hypothetical protein [Natrinema sp. 1APR25-10V2]
MSDTTAVHRAVTCIDDEREAIADRRAALEAFEKRVRDVPAETPTLAGSQYRQGTTAPLATTMTTGVSASGSSASTLGERCVTVREAFAETVRPHSTADIAADEPLAETIAAELTEDIAVALATETGWTPALKRAVLEETETRQRETTAYLETLREERQALEAAIDEIDEIVAWLQTTADESLLQCDFDALRAKHDRLERDRDRLETLARERQARLTDSTNRYGTGGTRYRSLLASFYSDLSVRYPLLSTATRLYEICGDCQRTVRAHLTRRV